MVLKHAILSGTSKENVISVGVERVAKSMNNSSKTIALHWFRHDLRISDNRALWQAASRADELVCVYVIDPDWLKPNRFQSAHLGKLRQAFLKQSLHTLHRELSDLGSGLLVLLGKPERVLAEFVIQNQIADVTCTEHCGWYERQQWAFLQGVCQDTQFHSFPGHCLFDESQLPFGLNELPQQFTQFRNLVEEIAIDSPLSELDHLPPLPATESSQKPENLNFEVSGAVILDHSLPCVFESGTRAARQRLTHYLFDSNHIATYKQTRNNLLGWDSSNKISPWLANGNISPKQVFRMLRKYERERISNESTYWLYFELMWREYFYWYAMKHGKRLFHPQGLGKRKQLMSFWPKRFAMWTQASTPWPLVNACMTELNTTGFLSNRGRQIVASCLVNELNVDWRFGAAWFEQQLIDFDVASNWGNWQYIAGVGCDPRGGRHFNIDKQTQQFDPQGEYMRYWLGDVIDHSITIADLDDTDAADWPVG